MTASSETVFKRLLKALRGAAAGTMLYAFISAEPIPAPRPRMTRWGGVFYAKDYTEFLATCQTQFASLGTAPLDGDLCLAMEIVREKPRTSKMLKPRGDMDNLLKGPMDGATQSGAIWGDDQQVSALVAAKRFAEPGEVPGIHFYWGVLN